MVDRAAEVVLLVACFALYAWWACNLPQTMAPDERMRYFVPTFIYENGCLPLGDDPAIRDEVWGTSYGFSVYGSSLLAVLFMSVAGFFGATGQSLLIAARFTSVLFSVGSVFLCLRIGARLFPRVVTAKFMLALFVGLLPQFVFISSYFNSDAMEVFCVALVVYCWLRGGQSHWRWGDCVFLGFALGLTALSYYYAYGAILASIFVYYASTCAVRKKDGAKADGAAVSYVCKPLLIFLVAFAIAGWFFVRNVLLYNGDFFGMTASSVTAEMYAQDNLKPSNRVTPRADGMSILDMLWGVHGGLNWLSSTIKSFVGIFGYMYIPLGKTTYYVYFALLGIGLLLSFICLLLCAMRLSTQKKVFIIGLSVLIIVPCALSIYYSWASDYEPQGRYLFAALVPIMIAIVTGYLWIASLFTSRRLKRDKQIAQAQPACVNVAQIVLPCALMAVWLFLFVWVFATRIVIECIGPVL